MKKKFSNIALDLGKSVELTQNARKNIIRSLVNSFTDTAFTLHMERLFNLETAVQGHKVMQGTNSESFVMVGDHSQLVKAPTFTSDSCLKDCVNLSPSTAVSRFKAKSPLKFFEKVLDLEPSELDIHTRLQTQRRVLELQGAGKNKNEITAKQEAEIKFTTGIAGNQSALIPLIDNLVVCTKRLSTDSTLAFDNSPHSLVSWCEALKKETPQILYKTT